MAIFVTVDFGSDVLKELSEVCDFEQLVCSDELQRLNTAGFQAARKCAVGKSSAS